MSQGHGTSLSWIERLLYDLRFAMRGLWRDRAFYADFLDWRAQAHSFEGLAFIDEKQVRFREGTGRPSD
jgi:hypothetical protein